MITLPAGYTEGIPPVSGRYSIIVRSVGGWWLTDSAHAVAFTVTPESAVYVDDESVYPWASVEQRTSGNWHENPDEIAWKAL